MAKHARIKRERAEREAAAAEEKERGPISAKDAATRSRVRRMAGFSDGSWAYNTRTREEVDRIIGLSGGADDYVTKPFSPREVVARVRTVLRRSRAAEAEDPSDGGRGGPLTFAGLTIDEARRESAATEHRSRSRPSSSTSLRALARSPGRVFSLAQLLEEVWGYDFYGDERVVDVHVRSIRSALGDDAAAPELIATVRGVGYKFIGEPSSAGSGRDGRSR